MISFELNNRIIDMPTEWHEITLEKYVEIARLDDFRKNSPIAELYIVKLIEVLCGLEENEGDDMEISKVTELIEKLSFLNEHPEWESVKHINIEGVDYVFPEDLNKLTMGEYISMKTLQQNFQNEADSIPYILAVILRTGRNIDGKWVQDKFDPATIEDRKNIFLKQPVYSLMAPISFFLSGKK